MEKILPSDLVNKGVIGLPDTPGLDTTQMQQKFDEIALDVIIPHYNDLIDELEEIILPATGDMKKSVYDTDDDGKVDAAEVADDATTVNSHTVESDVPADAVFTDTTYTAGTNITIDENNEISVTVSDLMKVDGSNTSSSTPVRFNTAFTVGSRGTGNYGTSSVAEGKSVRASGNYSHAEGLECNAAGTASHAEGILTVASANYSHASGNMTTAGYINQFVIGTSNDNKSTTLFEIGNGADPAHKSNALEIYKDGSLSQDNGTTKFLFTEVSGEKGYYDENGTFNAFGSGGGGSSTLAGLQDVDISGTPSGGEILKYNSTSSKWENGTETAQVQADWNQADNTAVDYIKNKPTIPDAQIQSDWNQADNTAKDFIKNKPTIPDDLNDLGDVAISSQTNGQVLSYNSTSGKWENATLSGGGDMQASTYDPNGDVATAGGIPAYINATVTSALTASY